MAVTKFYMPVVWRALSYDLAVGSTMGYDSSEPFQVNISFHDEFKTEWFMSRDLLQQGLEGSAGEGDVICWSTEDRYFLGLRNPHASLVLSAPLGSIEYLLDYTRLMVPPGTEMVDIDSLVERLLQ